MDFDLNDWDDDAIRAERNKARELRKSQWWNRRVAKGVCHYCHKPTPPKELTMDHTVPLARGGRSTKGNVVPCCKECNTRKKQLLPMEWAEHVERLSTNGNT
jgi:5-methylcytosine-specific restriction endonuclease McrA